MSLKAPNGYKDYREYIEAKLLQSLIAGHHYHISFYVSITASPYPVLYGTVISVDKIGACISDTMILDSANLVYSFLTNPATIETPPGQYIADSNVWTKISGTYTAHGGEQWITLGHFKDNLPQNDTLLYVTQDSAYSNDSFVYCYMYIDDVCVMDVNGSTSDTSFCAAAFPVTLADGGYQGSYQWSTGDTTAAISIPAPGVYWRAVRGECLYHTDTFTVKAQPSVNLGNDTLICAGDFITLGAYQPYVYYTWNTGDTACCISTDTSGIYSVTVYNACGSLSGSVSVTVSPCGQCMVIPSAFTPNHDGKNDAFKVISLCPLSKYNIKIYNRWGQLVYASNDVNNGWDGTFNGTTQDIGVYYYYIQYTPDLPGNTKEITLKGDVAIVR